MYVCQIQSLNMKHITRQEERIVKNLSSKEADVKLKFSYGKFSDFLTVVSGS